MAAQLSNWGQEATTSMLSDIKARIGVVIQGDFSPMSGAVLSVKQESTLPSSQSPHSDKASPSKCVRTKGGGQHPPWRTSRHKSSTTAASGASTCTPHTLPRPLPPHSAVAGALPLPLAFRASLAGKGAHSHRLREELHAEWEARLFFTSGTSTAPQKIDVPSGLGSSP